MASHDWDDLEPETQMSIELERTDDKGDPICGCAVARDGSWFLCTYHNGYNSGAYEVRLQHELDA
jgi:hypothetical protein